MEGSQGVEAVRRKKQPAPPTWLHAGVRVDYSSVIGEPPTQHNLIVRTDPQQLSSGHWVVWLEGKAGCVHVDAVRPTQKDPGEA